MTTLHVYAPSGVELRSAALKLARQRLTALGFAVTLDPSVRARQQRFAGSDEARLATLYRVADAAPAVAMACRGGYGLTRLLDRIDWPRIALSVEQGTRWVGYSDLTALQLGLLAHTGAATWHGPMACDDFGRSEDAGGIDEITRDCFAEAMSGVLAEPASQLLRQFFAGRRAQQRAEREALRVLELPDASLPVSAPDAAVPLIPTGDATELTGPLGQPDA